MLRFVLEDISRSKSKDIRDKSLEKSISKLSTAVFALHLLFRVQNPLTVLCGRKSHALIKPFREDSSCGILSYTVLSTGIHTCAVRATFGLFVSKWLSLSDI